MKARPAFSFWRLLLLFIASASLAHAGFSVGGSAYTKRFKTTLLAEPSPLAESTGEISFARKLSVREVRGNWVRVADGAIKGWVFAGNLATEKPADVKGLDGLPIAASQTTATAAARPLTPAANDYADRRNLGEARRDLDWLNVQCGKISESNVDHFLKEKKKGEFQ